MKNNYTRKLEEEIVLILKNINITCKENKGYFLENLLTNNIIICPSRSTLQASLQDIIYRQFYKRLDLLKSNDFFDGEPSLGTVRKKNQIFKKFIEDKSVLANVKNREVEEGWITESVSTETGYLVVQKHNYEKKLIFPGHYLNQSLDFPFSKDDSVKKVSWFKAKRLRNDDTYFYLHGEQIPDDYFGRVNQIRIYFNLIANKCFKENIGDFLSELLAAFNARKIPFQLKMLTIFFSNETDLNDKEYKVSDTSVVYLENTYFFMSIEIILRIAMQQRYKDMFADHVPMFTKQIARGIAFAESPTSTAESFGQSRSIYLAQYIVNHMIECILPDIDSVLNNIKECFPKGFYLNHNSYYPYNLDYNRKLKQGLVNINQQEQNLKVVMQVGFIICKNAIFDSEQSCNWIGSSEIRKFTTLNYGVLKGVAGIAIFLGDLYSITLEPTYLPIIKGALNCLENGLDRQETFGFYEGKLGVIYTLLKVYQQIEGSFDVTKFINDFEKKEFPTPKKAEDYNVLTGLSGELLGLLKIEACIDDSMRPWVRNIIEAKANMILGIDINLFLDGEDSLLTFSGYTQGLSGIGLSLIEAGILLNNNNFKAEGLKLIEFEIKNFKHIASKPSWDGSQGLSKVGHCLALNRFISLKVDNHKYAERLLEIYDSLEINKIFINDELREQSKKDIEFLELLTIEQGLAMLELIIQMRDNFSVGITNVFEKFYKRFLLDKISQQINDDTYSLLNQSKNSPFHVNLYQGLAGIGYGLLRIYDPTRVKSLLILDT